VDKKYRASYTTINLGGDDHWYLNSEQEIKNAITNGEHFVLETAIPFLEREFSYQNYCDLLNSDPAGPCAYHRNAQNRCHYGLIAAKFASDPRYEELKRIYAAYLRSTNNGFYYPRFEKLVTDLES